METYADYDYYKNEYRGQSDESSFNKYCIGATLEIQNHTHNRASKDVKEVKNCMCKLVDVMNENNHQQQSNISSEKVDNYTRNYVVKSEADKDKEYYTIIVKYLGRLGLLNGGVPIVY